MSGCPTGGPITGETVASIAARGLRNGPLLSLAERKSVAGSALRQYADGQPLTPAATMLFPGYPGERTSTRIVHLASKAMHGYDMTPAEVQELCGSVLTQRP